MIDRTEITPELIAERMAEARTERALVFVSLFQKLFARREPKRTLAGANA